MVKHSSGRRLSSATRALDRVFIALAHPARRAIVRRLARGEATVTAVAAPFDVSLVAVSKHIRQLERAGLVRRRVEGREHRLSLNPGPLGDAADWLAYYRAFWEGALDGLERHFAGGGAAPRKEAG